MRISRNIFAILLLLFVQLCVYGQQISRQEAIKAAVNAMNYQIGRQQLSETTVDTVFAKTSNGYTLWCISAQGRQCCYPGISLVFPY